MSTGGVRSCPEIQDVTRRRRGDQLPSIPILSAGANLCERREREIKEARELAWVIPYKTLGDVRGGIQRGVMQLIAESEMSPQRLTRGFCLDPLQ